MPIYMILLVTASLPQKGVIHNSFARVLCTSRAPNQIEFMVVMLVYDDPVPVLENGVTQDRICFISGSDPIFPRLCLPKNVRHRFCVASFGPSKHHRRKQLAHWNPEDILSQKTCTVYAKTLKLIILIWPTSKVMFNEVVRPNDHHFR